MAFSATKRELGELYTFFRLLADGAVSLGTPKAEKDETLRWPVALIQREEHDGTRRYYIEAQEVRIVSGTTAEIGYGPEGDNGQGWVSGVDLGYYPRPRTVLFGVNLKF